MGEHGLALKPQEGVIDRGQGTGCMESRGCATGQNNGEKVGIFGGDHELTADGTHAALWLYKTGHAQPRLGLPVGFWFMPHSLAPGISDCLVRRAITQ